MKPITSSIRDVLIEHIDGKRPFVLRAKSKAFQDSHDAIVRAPSIMASLRNGYLRMTGSPPFTVLTESGREVLARALADWADALSRAGFERRFRNDVISRPVQTMPAQNSDGANQGTAPRVARSAEDFTD
jgi:hypothetical protein